MRFYHTLFKPFVSFGFFTFPLYNMESDKDDELLNEGLGTSGLEFSDNWGDNIGSCEGD